MTRKMTRLRSMTGYAATTAQQDGFTLTVSLRSVNHRYLDLHLYLPDCLLPLEGKARSAIQSKNPRGHLELKTALEFQNGAGLAVDEALAGKYMEVFRRLGAQYGLPAEMTVAALSQLPGVVVRKDLTAGSEITPQLETTFLQAVEDVIERWDAMRAEEAAVLAEDLGARIEGIGKAVEQLEQWQQKTLRHAQRKLAERLQALVGQALLSQGVGGQAGLDPARLAQEALLLADRTDTSEELLRLKAHVAQFSALLEGEADAGRRLDFLLQEINREANTLVSKVAGLGEAGLPMTEVGLQMKAEVEKLREQVQNLQ